jgi:hypothetical protein
LRATTTLSKTMRIKAMLLNNRLNQFLIKSWTVGRVGSSDRRWIVGNKIYVVIKYLLRCIFIGFCVRLLYTVIIHYIWYDCKTYFSFSIPYRILFFKTSLQFMCVVIEGGELTFVRVEFILNPNWIITLFLVVKRVFW